MLIVESVKQKTGISRTRSVEGAESDKTTSGPFVPYAIYDYLSGAHELDVTVYAIRQILDAERVNHAYFCARLRERFERLMAALGPSEKD